jgi:hypothetical protein
VDENVASLLALLEVGLKFATYARLQVGRDRAAATTWAVAARLVAAKLSRNPAIDGHTQHVRLVSPAADEVHAHLVVGLFGHGCS